MNIGDKELHHTGTHAGGQTRGFEANTHISQYYKSPDPILFNSYSTLLGLITTDPY